MLWTALHPSCGITVGLGWKESHDGKGCYDWSDIAKSVLQVHGASEYGEVLVRRRLTRARMLPFFAKLPPCLIGIEACNNSHYWRVS